MRKSLTSGVLAALTMSAAALALAGCATPGPPIQTASGQPELTLEHVDAACIRSGFLNLLVNARMSIKSSTDAQIIAGKPSENLGANLLLSTRFGGAPEDRITFLFIGMPNDGLRIVVSEQLVSNAGTGFEMATPLNQSQMVQDQFEAAKSRIVAKCGRKA